MWVPPHSEESDKEIKMPLSGREDQNHKLQILKLDDQVRTEKTENSRVSGSESGKVSEIRVHFKEGTKKIVLDGVPEGHLSKEIAVRQVNSSHEIGQSDNSTQGECMQIQEHIKAQQEHERLETKETLTVSAKDKVQEKITLEECRTMIKRKITGNRHTKWIQRQWGKHCGKSTGIKDTIIGNKARKFSNPRVEGDDSQSSGSTDRSQCSSKATTKCLPLAYSFISFKTGISTVNSKTQFLSADCIQIWRNWRSGKPLQPPSDRSGNASQILKADAGHKLQTVYEEKEDHKLHRVDQENDRLHIVDDGNDGSTLPVLDEGNETPKPSTVDGGKDVSKLDVLNEGNELHNVDEGNQGFKKNLMPNPSQSATESLDAPSILLATSTLGSPKKEPEVVGSATITALQILNSDCKQTGENLALSNEINIFKDIMKGSPRRNHGLSLRTTAEVTKYLGELIHKICSAEAGCNVEDISSRSEDIKLLEKVDEDDKNDDKSLKLDSRVAEARKSIPDHSLVLHSTKPLSPYRVLFEEKNKDFLHEILTSLSEEAQLIKQAWNYSLKHTSILKGNQDKPKVVNDAGKLVKENDSLSLFLSLKDGKIQMKDKHQPQKELQNDCLSKLKKPEMTTEFYIKINQEELLKKLPSKPKAPPKVRYHSVKDHLSRLPGGDVGIIAHDHQDRPVMRGLNEA